jgi:pyruvate/2-oxoglutarate dehydrogenase complex dihydrolipoamide acyltransferase (E2) component
MSESTPIVIPRENVNDESVKLLAWLVADKEPVTAGQPIAEIESSKTVADVVAPAAGTLTHAHSVGDEVAVGGVLGHISTGAAVGNGSPAPATVVEPAPVATVMTAGIETRFSPKAQELIKLHSVDPSRFANRGLVRADDVTALLEGKPATVAKQISTEPAVAASAPVIGAAGVPIRSEPLPRSKKVEAKYLAASLRTGLPSVITVACPTRGLKQALADHPSLRGQISPIIIFETARLLRAFPFFNAYCSEGTANFYEQVHIGFAVDADRGLKVPVIRDADTKSLPDIASEMQELVIEYLNDTLAMKSLAGGTFTVTDLSGEGVFGFHPLINQGQSAILGIGAEFFPPGSREGMFNLILAFDHQISEGRAAAKFLNELKHRIAGYESAMETSAADPHCEECYASLSELSAMKHHYLLPTVGPRGTTRMVCTRCMMGYI